MMHDASLVPVPATLRRDKFPLIEGQDAAADVTCPRERPLEVLFRLSDAGGHGNEGQRARHGHLREECLAYAPREA